MSKASCALSAGASHGASLFDASHGAILYANRDAIPSRDAIPTCHSKAASIRKSRSNLASNRNSPASRTLDTIPSHASHSASSLPFRWG
jgi:hypothetical protein